jgi:predicted transcriptional regulator
LILIPLYTKLHHDEVLDHFVRGQIFGYIKANPGEHYNAIKESLELTNGTLSHHLKILEKEEYIYSKRDKFYSRFYPKGMKITPLDAAQLNKIQKIIVNKIRERPGLTQHEIITILGTSQQVVSYNLTKLTRDNVLSIKKDGREKRYYLNHVESELPVSPAAPPVISETQDQSSTQDQPQQMESPPTPTATPVVVSQDPQSDDSQLNENNIPKGQ